MDKKIGKNPLITIIPMVFMAIMTMWTLILNVISVFGLKSIADPKLLNGFLATVVLIIGIMVIKESIPFLWTSKAEKSL